MPSRREFLASLSAVALAAGACVDPVRAAAIAPDLAAWPGSPEEVAEDEAFWREVGQAYTVDREVVNLNNGGTSPSPAAVQQSMARHLARMNAWPPAYVLWREQLKQREEVRARLARAFGVDAEEIALTRNATEGLQICQMGLDLGRGDEVITTDRDYPRMISAFRQRERREGVRMVQVSLRGLERDPAGITARIAEHITPRTRMILICHVIFLNGQVLPVKEIAALGRERGIPVVVDGAHALAHLDFKISDLGCDFYAASLHKWLCAPHGTGLLYVNRRRIAELWPLAPAEAKLERDIRKFEQIGTHPEANTLAVADALAFHLGIGAARKLARLRYLRDRWVGPLAKHERVTIHTPLEAGLSGGIATFSLAGVDSPALAGWLWKHHRILVTTMDHADLAGVRVSPQVYNRPDEVDRFTAAVEHVIRHGLPGAKSDKPGG